MCIEGEMEIYFRGISFGDCGGESAIGWARPEFIDVATKLLNP